MTFRKDLLPPTRTFYEHELGKLSRPSRGWLKTNCCFHASKSRTSFSIHLDSGSFFCHGCGVKGGDVVSFVRLRYGLNFKEACQQLGVWDEGNKRTTKSLPRRLVPYLVLEFTIDGVEYRAEVPDKPTSDFQWLRKFYAEARDRLAELHLGDAEKFEGEEEVQWGILSAAWELIQMEVGR